MPSKTETISKTKAKNAAIAARRSRATAPLGSGSPKMAEPATRSSAPASATAPAVLMPIPPSISIAICNPRRAIMLRSRRTLSSECSMNF